ncbi:MAG: hypothetical protein J6O55_01300 [Lachnospiraceae bacterium]|nr:hypothetical protein [Lachnospiraceae bacterium]
MTNQEIQGWYRRLDWLDSICNIYARGLELYQVLAKTLKESSGTELIVSPANLGDTVFIAALSKAYKEAHGVKNLLICAKESQAEAVEWFEGVDEILGLSDEEILFLRYYFTVSRNFYSNGIRYGHIPCIIDASFPDFFVHIDPGFAGLPLINVWERRILDLPDHSATCDMVVPEEAMVGLDWVKYEKAVLIAPAAFTNKGIPISFWEKLTEKLSDMGITVYCNSGKLDYDCVIKGSIECVLTTKELILNAPLFRHVVSVRSGFTDLVSKTNAKLTVLHLGGEKEGNLRVQYGDIWDDVRDLGRKEGIYPIKYCGDREDEMIDLIIEDIENKEL